MVDEGVENQGEDTTDQDRAQLMADTADRLAVFSAAVGEPDMGLEPTEELTEEPTEEPVEEPVEEPAEELVEKPVEESVDEPVEESSEEDESKAVEPVEGEPTLPAAYRRSLLASEWSEDEINEFFAANPQGALTFAEKVHRTRNAQTAQFAAAGRQARQAAVAAPTPTATEAAQQAEGLMTPVDVDAMVEKLGNEEVIRAIATPVNAAIARINDMLPEVQKSVRVAQQASKEALYAQIDGFFGSEELKPFEEVYGAGSMTDMESLPKVQQENRKRILEDADAICAGAALQGRPLTVGEAMLMAHDSVAKEFQAKLIRKDIKKKTKKRAKGKSLKPTGQKPRSGSDRRPSTRNQLEKQVAVGLGQVFG